MKEKKHIKAKVFKTPENYFNNFNDELKIRIIEEQLKDKFGNKNPFSVPKDYFQTFSVKLNKKSSSKGKVIQLLKPYISIAAGIILVFAIWQVILTNVKNGTEIANNNFNNEIVEDNISFDDNQLADIDETMYNYIDNEDVIALLDYDEELENNIEIDVEEDEISEYLIDYADDTDFDEILTSL